MDFSVLLWLFLFIAAAVVAVKVAMKISKFVVSIISAVIVVILVFGVLAYTDVIDIGDTGLKDFSKAAISKGKDKVTGYVVEHGGDLLKDLKEEKTVEGS